jgi:hypothetical protein
MLTPKVLAPHIRPLLIPLSFLSSISIARPSVATSRIDVLSIIKDNNIPISNGDICIEMN